MFSYEIIVASVEANNEILLILFTFHIVENAFIQILLSVLKHLQYNLI